MSNQNIIKSYVEEAFRTNSFGVLATEGEGKPHACIIAITPIDDFVHLIFATYRNTSKYKNLIKNENVTILFENRSTKSLSQPDITVLTAFGFAKEVNISVSELVLQAHLSRHPKLESFLLSNDCAIFQVKVNAYQVVRGIEDISWWHIND